MKNALLLIILLSSTFTPAQVGEQPARVEVVDFFGQKGLDVDRVRAALPVREGETFPTLFGLMETRPQIEEAVGRVTGRPATGVSFVSPGRGAWIVYVGLPGKNLKGFTYNPAPKGAARLPAHALEIYKQVEAAFMDAMQRGAMGEDDSKGYALSRDDETLRAKQLAMREYASRNEGLIRDVLRSSSDDEHRRIAAQMLGYTNQSARQIADLVRASHDPDETVRNNATRALIVLAKSDAKVAAKIPASGFVGMLNSGEWSDRNKAGGLLEALTLWRTPRLLAALRTQAFDSLAEMARWRGAGHSHSARRMLGRIAGIEETRLTKLVDDDAQADVIIDAARRSR